MHSVCINIAAVHVCGLQIKLNVTRRCWCSHIQQLPPHPTPTPPSLLIEAWGENAIFLLLHVKLLRMWAKPSHMQAAFISIYIKCFWFQPQCLFPAWNKLFVGGERGGKGATETSPDCTGRGRPGKSWLICQVWRAVTSFCLWLRDGWGEQEFIRRFLQK